MKDPVQVEILGQRLTVASDDGEAHVREVAQMLEDRARDLATQFPRATILQLALLTALNIASECWKLSQDRADMDAAIVRLSEEVARFARSTNG